MGFCNNNNVAGTGCNGILGMDNNFLLLLLLFILLASDGFGCGCDGKENNFFFIIILAIIGLGGFGKTFGFGL